jgi:Ca2+-binding RTX toxin-like protein
MLLITFMFTSLFVKVHANQSNSVNSSISSGFSDILKSKIQDLISSALNGTDNIMNSSTLHNNESNLSSSQLLVSKNKVVSSIKSNSSDGGNYMVKDKVTTINGVCNSIKVGGNGNDSLYSSGNCNDELTGGLGADKFTCGEGSDTIKDFNPKEGDVILDKQNCEKIL